MHRAALLAVALAACAPEPPPPAAAHAARALAPGELSDQTALLSLVLDADGARFDHAATRPFAFRRVAARVPGELSDHTLEVRYGPREPVRLPLALGHPTDRSAGAQSAWAGGGTIVRAPYFGPGTRYVLLGERGAEVLAELEVAE